MNGAQDLGGMQNFGPVVPESEEPVFHADWERRAFALTLAMGATGEWNLDMGRHARERLAPARYLASSYYEIWLAGLRSLMIARGLVTAEEVDQGRMLAPAKPVKRKLEAGAVARALAAGGPTTRAAATAARFKAGERVRARNLHPAGHTRLPRYVRGHVGEIARIHGVHVFPDSNARGAGEAPQWLYGVRFSARELWGEEAAFLDQVHVDCFESYLEPA
jgi:nitrile hydratase beta subunit